MWVWELRLLLPYKKPQWRWASSFIVFLSSGIWLSAYAVFVFNLNQNLHRTSVYKHPHPAEWFLYPLDIQKPKATQGWVHDSTCSIFQDGVCTVWASQIFQKPKPSSVFYRVTTSTYPSFHPSPCRITAWGNTPSSWRWTRSRTSCWPRRASRTWRSGLARWPASYRSVPTTVQPPTARAWTSPTIGRVRCLLYSGRHKVCLQYGGCRMWDLKNSRKEQNGDLEQKGVFKERHLA